MDRRTTSNGSFLPRLIIFIRHLFGLSHCLQDVSKGNAIAKIQNVKGKVHNRLELLALPAEV
jgi:hypothetical protein